jgi:methylmalonyl-CoA mutase cobalamin-binding domain/chain
MGGRRASRIWSRRAALSGSHRELIPRIVARLTEARVDAPVVVGGIIPEADVPALKEAGVAAVYTPKDFDLTGIMRDIVALVAERNGWPRQAAERAQTARPARICLRP